MQRSQLDGFRAAFESAVDAQLGGRQPTAVLTCEAEVAPDDLTLALAMEIDRLEPFGKANERPVFAMRGVELGGQLRPLGAEGKHYSFQAVGGERTFRAVAFNFDTRRDELETLAWRKVDLAFELRRSEYSGPAGFELCVKDIRAATRGGLRKAAGAESSQPQ
jgi:single-stranded-DNA-specific exonuclease